MAVKALETGFYTDCSSIVQSTKKWMGEYTVFFTSNWWRTSEFFFHNIIFEQIIISLVCLYSKSSTLSSTPKDNFCHAFIHWLVYAESHRGTKQGPWVSCQFPCFWFVLDWFGSVWFGLCALSQLSLHLLQGSTPLVTGPWPPKGHLCTSLCCSPCPSPVFSK